MEDFRNYFESGNSDNDENMRDENELENEEGSIDMRDEEESENIGFKYDENDFRKDNIINFLFDNKLLKNNPICYKCHQQMKLVKDKKRVDGRIWRCSKKGNNKHDNRINIRNGSVFEKFKTDIRILYFLIFYNFVENKSVKDSYNNSLEFSKQLHIEYTTKKLVSKFFNVLRINIKNKMHKSWNENKLGIEPCINGKCYCEIDESKIINYNNETRWMFGIYDRGSKDVRIFYVDNNRTKETLLSIIKRHICTYYERIENNNDPNEINYPTRIFSDCFQTYQISDFNNLGYKLYKVNHSVWFGQGHFHTNSIEGTWSRIKRLSRSFNGLNGNIFNTTRNIDNKEYFEGWICTAIFFMKCESLNLALNQRKNFLLDYLQFQ